MRRRALSALGLVLIAAALLPASVSAHAMLEATVPERGAHLQHAPAQVEFRFDESVEAAFGTLRVFDAHGHEVQTGAVFHPGGRGSRVAVRLRPGLGDGAYTATYRVISADGHPVSSGFVFTVGNAAPPAHGVDAMLAESGTGTVTRAALAVARGVQYGAITLGLGTVVFLLVCWAPAMTAGRRAAARPFARRTDRLLMAAVVAGVVSAAAAIVLEAAVGLSGSAWSALHADVVREALGVRFGTAWGLGLLAWLLAGAVLGVRAVAPARAARPAMPAAPPPAPPDDGSAAVAVAAPPVVAHAPPAAPARDPWLPVLAVPLSALALLPAFGGHPTVQSPVAVLAPANVLHVVAVSAWLGGVAVLVTALRTTTAPLEPSLLATVVGRFSALATIALPVLLVTGAAQAIVEVRTPAHLLDTAFGRAVLIKIALAAGIAALGWANRSRRLPALRRAAAGASPGRAGVLLQRALRAELAVGVVALAATGALSGYAPSTAVSAGPYATTTTVGPARLEVTVDPARTGPNQVHLYLSDRRTGAPFRATKELKVTAALPHRHIAPITLSPHLAGPGDFVVDRATLAVAGDWTFSVTDRVSDFDEYETRFTVPIR